MKKYIQGKMKNRELINDFADCYLRLLTHNDDFLLKQSREQVPKVKPQEMLG